MLPCKKEKQKEKDTYYRMFRFWSMHMSWHLKYRMSLILALEVIKGLLTFWKIAGFGLRSNV